MYYQLFENRRFGNTKFWVFSIDVLPNNLIYAIGNTISSATVMKTFETATEPVEMYYQIPRINIFGNTFLILYQKFVLPNHLKNANWQYKSQADDPNKPQFVK